MKRIVAQRATEVAQRATEETLRVTQCRLCGPLSNKKTNSKTTLSTNVQVIGEKIRQKDR